MIKIFDEVVLADVYLNTLGIFHKIKVKENIARKLNIKRFVITHQIPTEDRVVPIEASGESVTESNKALRHKREGTILNKGRS